MPRCCWHTAISQPLLLLLLQVQSLLDRTATGGMDWGNCCVYGITEEGGAVVQPEVRAAAASLAACWLVCFDCVLPPVATFAAAGAGSQLNVLLLLAAGHACCHFTCCCSASHNGSTGALLVACRSRHTQSAAPPPITRRK